MRRAIGVLLLIALSGCASAPDIALACPPAPKPYTVGQQAAAAVELRSLPADSVLGVFMADYAAARASARACRTNH